MSLWRKNRPDAKALEAQVTALQAALDTCKGVARRWVGMQRVTIAAGGVALLALGFVLGVYSEDIKDSAADVTSAIGLTSPRGPEAGYAAYDKGDHVTALRLLQPLGEQGDARAQSVLGAINYAGHGVQRNDAEAVRWFRLAADQGDAPAQFRLGLMYSDGDGVPQDQTEAARWYRLAADAGHAQAQYNLALLYAAGQGVAQDNVAAYMWLNLAVAHFPASDSRNRTIAAKSREVAASKLTREQLAEAQRLSREWRPVRPSHYAGPTS
jgi:uncharacterized protein